MAGMQWRYWEPVQCLQDGSEGKHVLMKLNRPIGQNVNLFKCLWRNACFKALVDGAANVMYDHPELSPPHYVPDIITGDFDSARPEVLGHYKGLGVEIRNTPNQDLTDFTKCTQIVCDKIKAQDSKVSCIVAHVSFDGRTDHVMGNINTLFLAQGMTDLPVYLVSEDSVVFLLPPGRHKVRVDSPLLDTMCGLIPIGSPCRCATTTGLTYNLDRHRMAFGELVSTSNSFDGSPEVMVDTSDNLLFTMGIKPL